jgi:hypothetical protein
LEFEIRQLVQKLKKGTKVETQHPSSHSNGNTFVVGSVYCLFGKHKWGGDDFNTCINCQKKAIGLPKYENPPPPPAINKQVY